MEHTKKRIKILTAGVITVKGFINGPVLTPYYEKLDIIFKMLASGIKVNEVLEDGTEIELSISNFKNNNSVEEDVEESTSEGAEEAEDDNTSVDGESDEEQETSSTLKIEDVEDSSPEDDNTPVEESTSEGAEEAEDDNTFVDGESDEESGVETTTESEDQLSVDELGSVDNNINKHKNNKKNKHHNRR